jgi:WD40 repeat protein
MSGTFSPDGNSILSGSDDLTLRIWDTETGQCHRTLVGHSEVFQRCCWHFSPTGGCTILSASVDKTLMLWKADTGQLLRIFDDHAESANSCTFSQNGEALIAGYRDGIMVLWGTARQPCLPH